MPDETTSSCFETGNTPSVSSWEVYWEPDNVENVGYQFATVEHLRAEGIDAEGVPVGSLDKHGRLALNSFMFENGKVLFPKEGCEELIMQLTGFGKEKHDDLVDATTIVVTKLFEFASKAQPRVRYI